MESQGLAHSKRMSNSAGSNIDLCGVKYSDSTLRILRGRNSFDLVLTNGFRDSLLRFSVGRSTGCSNSPNNPQSVAPQPWAPVPVDVNRNFFSPSQVFDFLELIPVSNGGQNGKNALINAYHAALNSFQDVPTNFEKTIAIIKKIKDLGYESIYDYTYPIIVDAPQNRYRESIILAAINYVIGASPISAEVYNSNFLLPNQPIISYPTTNQIGWIKINKANEADQDPPIINIPTSQIADIDLNIFSFGDEIGRIENIINGHEPAYFTTIYFFQGRYYHDVFFEKLLPSGFYTSNSHTIYEVSNGAFVRLFSLNPCPSCPFNNLPPLLNPFGSL